VGSGDVEEDFDEGDADGDEQTDLHGHEEHAEEGAHDGQEVELVDLPDEIRGFHVDECRDGGDDDGGQDGVGRILEQGRECYQDDAHHHAMIMFAMAVFTPAW